MIYTIFSSIFERDPRRRWKLKKIEELISESKNGLIPLEDESLVGVDLLRNSLIRPQNKKTTSKSILDAL